MDETTLAASVLPPVQRVHSGDTQESHFVVTAGEAVIQGNRIIVTFQVEGTPPEVQADLLLYNAMLRFEGQNAFTQAPINISGGPSWYIDGGSALLFVHGANSEDPSRPLTLEATIMRDASIQVFALTTSLPEGWPQVESVAVNVIRFVEPRQGVDATGPTYAVPLREGEVPDLGLAPGSVPFPAPSEAAGDVPDTFPTLALPGGWETFVVSQEAIHMGAPDGMAFAGIIVSGVPGTADEILGRFVVESDGGYVVESEPGPLGPFEASMVLRAASEVRVEPVVGEVLTSGWLSGAGNVLHVGAVTRDGVTYLAYIEVPPGGDIELWRSILEGASFQ